MVNEPKPRTCRSVAVFFCRVSGVVLVLSLVALFAAKPALAVTHLIDILGPAGSGSFGKTVTTLPNGNIVVTDPNYDAGAESDVGAVYLFNGTTGALISTLTGSYSQDHVGDGGVVVLSNGHYLVLSPSWNTGAGAVTWGNATTGIQGSVSSFNSIVGSHYLDLVGSNGVAVLSNGNYVVSSPNWDNGDLIDTGAATWGNGANGSNGVVSAANSLVGGNVGDQVSSSGVITLSNGHYVVSSPYWDSGVISDTGAVTWGSGTSGVVGIIAANNSLIGTTAYDYVGARFVNGQAISNVLALSNGNYVVGSPYWDNESTTDVGAATWGNGSSGISGVISLDNSLVGSSNGDRIGSRQVGGSENNGIFALKNGNYVVTSPHWDNETNTDAGAATWGSGTAGIKGVITSTNSLVGTSANNLVGIGGVTALSNGNYVVASYLWESNLALDIGAITWGSGTLGSKGILTRTNSLIGATTGDMVGSAGVVALTNGNYVIASPWWDNGLLANVGAATWGSGTSNLVGIVSTTNSLIGSTPFDQVGVNLNGNGIVALTNGHYVVSSPYWNNGGNANAGAVTWRNGTANGAGVVATSNSIVGNFMDSRVGLNGVIALTNGHYVVVSPEWWNGNLPYLGAVTWATGAGSSSSIVSSANSLVGNSSNDYIGSGGVVALATGNYAIASPYWNGTAIDSGAVTWGNGTYGSSGVVSTTNSLVGSAAYDRVGNGGIQALRNGEYAIRNAEWNNGATANSGAVTWGSQLTGVVSSANSVLGTVPNSGAQHVFAYDASGDQLVIGRPAENSIAFWRKGNAPPQTTLLKTSPAITGPSAWVVFGGSDSDGASLRYECNLDGSGFAACSSPQLYRGLADGEHTLQVRAVDGQNLADPTPVNHIWRSQANLTQIAIGLDLQPNMSSNIKFTGHFGTFYLDDPTLDDGDTYSHTKLVPVTAGTYVISETVPTGWRLIDIDCVPAAAAVTNINSKNVTISIKEGESVGCTFVTQRSVSISARAYNDLVRTGLDLGRRNVGDPYLAGWSMSVYISPTSVITTKVTSAGSLAQASFAGLIAGSYVVCEVLPAGWVHSDPKPTAAAVPGYAGQLCKAVTLAPGKSATLLFGQYLATAIGADGIGSEATSTDLLEGPAMIVDPDEIDPEVEVDGFVDLPLEVEQEEDVMPHEEQISLDQLAVKPVVESALSNRVFLPIVQR